LQDLKINLSLLKKLMRRSTLALLFSFAFVFGNAQRLAKYAVSNTGCSVYMFCDPGEFKLELSDDSSKIYTAECVNDGVTYGVICIKLRVPNVDLDAAENVVIAYLDYLKTSFKIQKSAGYGKGNRLNNNENTRGVTDYWQDADSQNWKIKGWTNGSYIGVVYINSKTELNETKSNVFLNSFRMPGM
jgi:hypothetical protein